MRRDDPFALTKVGRPSRGIDGLRRRYPLESPTNSPGRPLAMCRPGLAAHRGARPAAPLSPAGLSIEEHGTPRFALDFPDRGRGSEPRRTRTAGITEEQGTVMVRSGFLAPLRGARPGDDTRRAPAGAQERASPGNTRRAATCRRPPLRGRRGRRAPPPALPATDRRGGTARRRPEGPVSSGFPVEAWDDRLGDRHPAAAVLTHDPAPRTRRGPRHRSAGRTGLAP